MQRKRYDLNMSGSIQEPNFETACQWWDDLEDIWTPVGWPDHMFRFNVFWNGRILAKPDLNNRTKEWEGQGALFSVPDRMTNDDGMMSQGWNDCEAPVLWTQGYGGRGLRSEVFAHIPGGGDVKTGIEPLFAWVRLSYPKKVETDFPLPSPEVFGAEVLINSTITKNFMEKRNNLFFSYDTRYPRELITDGKNYSKTNGFRLKEQDGRVRFGVAPGQDCEVLFKPVSWYTTGFSLVEEKGNYRLGVAPVESCEAILRPIYIRTGEAIAKMAPSYQLHRMNLKGSSRIDLLIPMLPVAQEVFDKELALGWDKALEEANHYWSWKTKTKTMFSVPETYINECVKQNVRFSHLLAEKNPSTGKYCKFIGSFEYTELWPTPMSLELIMLMDTLGYHDFVERYLHIFKDEQGTVKPPGVAYKKHPGYLSTPASYKSIDWLSDNGAILYTLAMHGLLSGNKKYIEQFTDAIIKSCEWIRDSRALKNHGGYEGVLPAANATDFEANTQAIWSIGWNYKGLCSAVKFLKRIKHPRAAEFEEEAQDFREVFLKTFRHEVSRMPTWKDARGNKHKCVPTELAKDKPPSFSLHIVSLDTGPLFLVFAGLMEANDPIMKDTLLWFRDGPQRKFHKYDGQWSQIPMLNHEMSSAEPCYSWNLFHSLQTGDRGKFLEGMYSLFAGSISRKTLIGCETRGGVTGLACPASLPIYLARLAVVDDEIKEGELHLLRLAPLAWLRPDCLTRFERMPTEYGPVTLVFGLSKDKKRLNIKLETDFREAPGKMILHVPPVAGLRAVAVNGRKYAVGKKQTIQIA